MHQEQTLQDILAIVQFMKENMATKEDLEGFATSDGLEKIKNDLMNHMDGFIGLHQKLDTELTALRAKYDRLQEQMEKIARHLQLDIQ